MSQVRTLIILIFSSSVFFLKPMFYNFLFLNKSHEKTQNNSPLFISKLLKTCKMRHTIALADTWLTLQFILGQYHILPNIHLCTKCVLTL